VVYRKIEEQAFREKKVRHWPFIKRLPYRGENEFRIIYEDRGIEPHSLYPLPFSIESIERVYLSPWIKSAAFKSVKKTIQNMPNCQNIKVSKTTLLDNERWKNSLEV
jgi:hypothetical protein